MIFRSIVRCALLLAALAGGVAAQAAAQARPPNIVFLLTDDHRADALGAAGNGVIETPRLDEMAREGVRFGNAYVTTPICMISRASTFSGQYERRHGIHDFATEFTPEALALGHGVGHGDEELGEVPADLPLDADGHDGPREVVGLHPVGDAL